MTKISRRMPKIKKNYCIKPLTEINNKNMISDNTITVVLFSKKYHFTIENENETILDLKKAIKKLDDLQNPSLSQIEIFIENKSEGGYIEIFKDDIKLISIKNDLLYTLIKNKDFTSTKEVEIINRIDKSHQIKIDCPDDEQIQIVSRILEDNGINTPSLHSLIIYNFLAKQLYPLTTSIEVNTTLTELYLLGCLYQLKENDVELIEKMLNINKTLKVLSLSFNNIDEKAIINIIKAVKINTNLETFDISNNYIEDIGAEALESVLIVNTSLVNLYLTNNGITCKGVKALANGLHFNLSLKELLLDYNQIDDKGAISLAEALETNISLIKLDLNGNIIKDKGALAFSRLILNNNTLKILSLNHNQIGNKGAIFLAEALELNTGLTDIDISDNQLTNDVIRIFDEMVLQNKLSNKFLYSFNK